MILTEDQLAHYGILRKSGRYPWGSGGPEEASNAGFLGLIDKLKKEGLTEPEIAKYLSTDEHPVTTTSLRAAKSIATNEERASRIAQVQRMHDKGMSNGAIAERLGIANESSVRSLLQAGAQDKADQLQSVASMLERQVADKQFVDIGTGVAQQLGLSESRLATAVEILKQKDYTVQNVQVDQVGMGPGNKTTVKVLAPPGTTYRDIVTQKDKISQINEFSDDGGRTMKLMQPPMSIDSKRVAVKYGEDGGDKADGVIYVRPGVDDISIGANRYAQVRIAVDGTHFLKGMAVYKDDLPDGVDLMFNTNKSNKGDKLAAMKPMKAEEDNPFGAMVRQRLGPDGKPNSVMNIVGIKEGSGEEGAWEMWSKNLSTQMLSKQSPQLIREQLDITYERKKRELDEIRALTNPTVRTKLLDSFADGADSAAVHLKAAALPRQSTRVILPGASVKDNEIYAPGFKNGERVVLIRYPHAGVFEVPELTVNNRNREGLNTIGKDAKDAVLINHKTAQKMSGADFDGDTVIVIPNNNGKIRTAPALQGLKGFDPQRAYPAYDGMKTMGGGKWDAAKGREVYPEGKGPSGRTKGMQMGMVSNLITDMTIRGASMEEMARAVRHSMVVIDAEKHSLNWKESAKANGISALTAKYQPRDDGRTTGGASTLISRAGSETRIDKRRLRPAQDGGPVDSMTGKKVYVNTGESYQDKQGRTVMRKESIEKLALTDDARTLSSGTVQETAYATHSNRLKALANEARKETLGVPRVPYSPSAKKTYAAEVEALNAKLNTAIRNRPLERQAQVLASTQVQLKRQSNPDMDRATVKKVETMALTEARLRTGAQRQLIDITENEWKAIQAGAITNAKLEAILQKADLDQVKQYAMPREAPVMSSSMATRARSMSKSGYDQAEIAEALGVSLTTLKTSLAD